MIQEPMVQSSSERSLPAERHFVLIADDDESQVAALELSLSRQGYDTFSAHSGPSALKLARQQRPDLILLDVQLPEMDGLRVCTHLADDVATCHIPVIILSGMARPDIVSCSRGAGCKYFVRKPYDPNALLTLIEHSIAGAGEFDW